MTQADQVVEAMREKGGYATLKGLYDLVPEKGWDKQWSTKTPFATIRRIVQKDSRFFKIRPGLWGLTELSEEIMRKLSIDESASPEQVQEFDHSYYQGLVVEIGNLLEYKTFVPKQDRNKKFLGRSLSEIVSAEEIYQFSYPRFVRTASTIDVIWFNAREMPCAFWEIEHTTDFRVALLKFVDLQDFRAKFYVVADAARRNQFMEKINSDAFKPIQKWVQFISYEKLGELHAAAKEYPKVRDL